MGATLKSRPTRRSRVGQYRSAASGGTASERGADGDLACRKRQRKSSEHAGAKRFCRDPAREPLSGSRLDLSPPDRATRSEERGAAKSEGATKSEEGATQGKAVAAGEAQRKRQSRPVSSETAVAARVRSVAASSKARPFFFKPHTATSDASPWARPIKRAQAGLDVRLVISTIARLAPHARPATRCLLGHGLVVGRVVLVLRVCAPAVAVAAAPSPIRPSPAIYPRSWPFSDAPSLTSYSHSRLCPILSLIHV
jgi:hypothetical protein